MPFGDVYTRDVDICFISSNSHSYLIDAIPVNCVNYKKHNHGEKMIP